MFNDLNGLEPSETIDTDGDGEPDFYVYNYTTEEIIIVDYGFHYYGLGLSRYTPTPSLKTITVSGRVFITSFSEEPSFPDDFGSNDILVLDNRNHLNDNGNPDPGYRVYNSYTISGTAQQREILNAIFDYDSCFPSKYKWNHNMSTALKEWEIHNFAYMAYSILNLLGDYSKKLKSCAHVDLDNDDIGKGILDYLKR